MSDDQPDPSPPDGSGDDRAARATGVLNRSGEWSPKGGELFVHSHVFESVDGAERSGLDDVVDADSSALAKEIVKLRAKDSANSGVQTLVVGSDTAMLASIREYVSKNRVTIASGDRLMFDDAGAAYRVSEGGEPESLDPKGRSDSNAHIVVRAAAAIAGLLRI